MSNIVFDHSTYAGISTQATRSVTVSTPATGNRVIVGSVSGIAPDSFVINAFTLDGNNPDFVYSNSIDGATDYRVRLGIWLNPSIGDHTLSVTFNKAPSSYSQAIAGYSLSKVNQSSPYIDIGGSSQTYTNVPNGAVAIGHVVSSAANTIGADQTALYNSTYCTVWYTGNCADGDLTATVTGGGSRRLATVLLRPASFAGGVMFFMKG